MKQIINPYVRFRRKAQGRYANRIASSVYGRGVSQDEQACFFVENAGMGVDPANLITICFNKDMENCDIGWTFKKNGTPFTNVATAVNADPDCISFTADDVASTVYAWSLLEPPISGTSEWVDEDRQWVDLIEDATNNGSEFGKIDVPPAYIDDNTITIWQCSFQQLSTGHHARLQVFNKDVNDANLDVNLETGAELQFTDVSGIVQDYGFTSDGDGWYTLWMAFDSSSGVADIDCNAFAVLDSGHTAHNWVDDRPAISIRDPYLYESGINSAGPDDTITMSYTPGTCGAVGEEDCFLDEFVDAPVDNLIWGPIALRVGDFADNILVAFFDDPASVIGAKWTIERNGINEAGFIPSIVNGNIQFALTTDVSVTDVMTLTQDAVNVPGARATDGRYCWRFFDAAVVNAVGVEFWETETNDAYLLESGVSRWALDG